MDEDGCRGRGSGAGSVALERLREADASRGDQLRAARRFRDSLSGVDVAGLSDEQRVELVAELERVKGASSAAQARLVHAVRRSREQGEPRDVARSVGSGGGAGSS